jgi:hypothetical protein
MKKYIVSRTVVQSVGVEAESPTEAISIAKEEYSIRDDCFHDYEPLLWEWKVAEEGSDGQIIREWKVIEVSPDDQPPATTGPAEDEIPHQLAQRIYWNEPAT